MDKPKAYKYSLYVSDAFCEKLKVARGHRGLTQKELAFRSGIGLQTLQRLEAGARPPALSSLRKLCDGLECSADFLIGRCDWTDARIVSTAKARADSRFEP